MTEPNANDDYTYRSQLNTAIDQLRLALKTADTGEWIRLLNGALQNTGNAIGSSPSSTRTARDGPHENRNRAPGLPWG